MADYSRSSLPPAIQAISLMADFFKDALMHVIQAICQTNTDSDHDTVIEMKFKYKKIIVSANNEDQLSPQSPRMKAFNVSLAGLLN